jgi:hypothetical protein
MTTSSVPEGDGTSKTNDGTTRVSVVNAVTAQTVTALWCEDVDDVSAVQIVMRASDGG